VVGVGCRRAAALRRRIGACSALFVVVRVSA